jgi:DNA polymerase-4
MGPWYRRLARGVDRTPVVADPYVARSHGRETTFQQDLTMRGEVEEEVRRLARRVADDVRKDGRPAVRVAIKVRYAPFDTHTHSATLDEPTDDAEAIERAALDLLAKVKRDRAIRLLGVRAELAPPAAPAESR